MPPIYKRIDPECIWRSPYEWGSILRHNAEPRILESPERLACFIPRVSVTGEVAIQVPPLNLDKC